jgi:hypothetical protein
MNSYLLSFLLNLPHFSGPLVPADFPSSFNKPLNASGDHSLPSNAWHGPDTLLTYVGDAKRLSKRLILAQGCPSHETFYPEDSSKPVRDWDYSCAGGKVTGWNGLRDSGAYFYKDGLLDSAIRFFRRSPDSAFRVSETFRFGYDAQGRPSTRKAYGYEEEDTATYGDNTTFTYALPDSLGFRRIPWDKVAGSDSMEVNDFVIRLSEGKPVAMTQTNEDGGAFTRFDLTWSYGDPASVRKGRGRESARTFRMAGWGQAGFGWRVDGRALPGRASPGP